MGSGRTKFTGFPEISINPRRTDRSISFEQGGWHVLVNDHFHLLVRTSASRYPKPRGHYHLDEGSFVFSWQGHQILVDPGTFTYTRNKKGRDHFRSRPMHNVVLPEEEKNIVLEGQPYWGLGKAFEVIPESFAETRLRISGKKLQEDRRFTREFWLENSRIILKDQFPGPFRAHFHLHPALEVKSVESNQLEMGQLRFIVKTKSELTTERYAYSPSYGRKEEATRIVVKADQELEVQWEAV